jgi:hypothetical protein
VWGIGKDGDAEAKGHGLSRGSLAEASSIPPRWEW